MQQASREGAQKMIYVDANEKKKKTNNKIQKTNYEQQQQ